MAVNFWWRSLFSRELEHPEIFLSKEYIANRVVRHLVMTKMDRCLSAICQFAQSYYEGKLWPVHNTFVETDLARADDGEVAKRLFELRMDHVYMVRTFGRAGCFRAGSLDLNLVSLTLALAAYRRRRCDNDERFERVLVRAARGDGARLRRRLTEDLSPPSAAILADQFDRIRSEFFQEFYPG